MRLAVRLPFPLGFAAALVAAGLAGPALAGREPPPAAAPADQQVDLIRVDKSDRMMMLMRDGEIVRTYRVALGREPVGHKRKSGDGRTPTGRYMIDWRNPQSDFHLSLRISYPNSADRMEALVRGVDPGGSIMIHGDGSRRDVNGLLETEGDWTDGCIAVTDVEMDEIWALTPNGAVIEIRE